MDAVDFERDLASDARGDLASLSGRSGGAGVEALGLGDDSAGGGLDDDDERRGKGGGDCLAIGDLGDSCKIFEGGTSLLS